MEIVPENRFSGKTYCYTIASRVCKDEDEEVLRLPDGNIVVVGEEAYSAPELMFCPEMGNKKMAPPPASSMFSSSSSSSSSPPADKTAGLAELVYQGPYSVLS